MFELKDLPFILPEDLYSGNALPEDPSKIEWYSFLNQSIINLIPALVHIVHAPSGDIVWRNTEWDDFIPAHKTLNQQDFSSILKEHIHPKDYNLLEESTEYFNNKEGSVFGGIIRVKLSKREGWSWLIGVSRTIKKTEEGSPLYTLAVFMDFTEATQTNTQIAVALREVLLRSNKEILEKLTNREKEVLLLLIKGCKTKQIAEKLFISHHTVQSHRKNLKMKLDVKNTSEMIALAKDLGLY